MDGSPPHVARCSLRLRRCRGVAEIMWNNILTWLERHARSRYVRMMEEEVARLRAENRALVNSLLGTAGFPPIALDDEVRRGPVAMSPGRRGTWTQIARGREGGGGGGGIRGSCVVVRLPR